MNLPALTKERFIEHLLGENRLYKTGDLVRCLPDDNLAFMGRIDEQIKIRGFRIEPAEIESILLNHADIQQAAVVVSDAWGHNLVAYYTEKTKNSPLSQIALKDYLTQKLPDYMVPVALIQLPQMPLTFSGKIDKKHCFL